MAAEESRYSALTERVTVRVEGSTKEAIEAMAASEGVSVATMSRRCLDAGIASMMSGGGAAAYVKEAVAELRHIRSTLAKPGKAAFAACSMLAAMYRDQLEESWRSMPEGMRETPEARRAEYWAARSAGELFDLYMQSGGRLMADRSLGYWASFAPALGKSPWAEASTDEILGMDAGEWAERTQSNDAARLRTLGSGNGQEGGGRA